MPQIIHTITTAIKRIGVTLVTYWYVLVVIGIMSSIPQQAQASGCQPIYGGGLTCEDNSHSIQKQVLNPSTNHFVHNLGSHDSKYQANDLVTFQITLTNNGSKPLQKVV